MTFIWYKLLEPINSCLKTVCIANCKKNVNMYKETAFERWNLLLTYTLTFNLNVILTLNDLQMGLKNNIFAWNNKKGNKKDQNSK